MAPLERYRSLAQLSAGVTFVIKKKIRPSNLMVSSGALASSALYTVNDDAEEGNIALINSDSITIGAGGTSKVDTLAPVAFLNAERSTTVGVRNLSVFTVTLPEGLMDPPANSTVATSSGIGELQLGGVHIT
jgi:hypothetical protein